MAKDTDAGIFIGKGETEQHLYLKFGNRHGLIAGATGTGKTVSLQILAEGFSRNGVPVFMADVKGDLSGVSQAGAENPKLAERARSLGMKEYRLEGFPTMYWDLFGEQGQPVRTTISEMGPVLLSRLLDLNETQEGVLNIMFRVADEQGLLLLDLKDLRSMLAWVADQSADLTTAYGTVRRVSVGAIQRRLLVLEEQGGDHFFGEPALELADFMRTDSKGYGYINVLAADKLMSNPRLYATFMLWLLSELFEELPEVGDPDKPRLVFFFDEAHLLFDDAPKALLDKIEQVARLIRSKGVGVYFISQNPLDIPEKILGQLGNRIQHALRAFTPRDQRAVKSAAETFRSGKGFDAARAITELAVGEALVSTLEGKGTPGVVQRTMIRPPSSRMGPITPGERAQALKTGPVSGKYDRMIDRESAYEVLKVRAEKARLEAEAAAAAKQAEARAAKEERESRRPTFLESVGKSVMRSLATSLGRQIMRGILGSIFKGR